MRTEIMSKEEASKRMWGEYTLIAKRRRDKKIKTLQEKRRKTMEFRKAAHKYGLRATKRQESKFSRGLGYLFTRAIKKQPCHLPTEARDDTGNYEETVFKEPGKTKRKKRASKRPFRRIDV